MWQVWRARVELCNYSFRNSSCSIRCACNMDAYQRGFNPTRVVFIHTLFSIISKSSFISIWNIVGRQVWHVHYSFFKSEFQFFAQRHKFNSLRKECYQLKRGLRGACEDAATQTKERWSDLENKPSGRFFCFIFFISIQLLLVRYYHFPFNPQLVICEYESLFLGLIVQSR